MMKDHNIIDIHCHSVLKHFRNKEKNIPACEEITSPVNEFTDKIFGRESYRSYHTQADFGKLVQGGVGAVIISLSPIERKWFMHEKLAAPVLESKSELIAGITGFSVDYVNKLSKKLHTKDTIRYFEELEEEYNFLLKQLNNPCHGKDIKICTNYSEFEENKKSGKSISVIISIEGGHALGTLKPRDLNKKTEFIPGEDYESKFRNNVFKVKSWGPDGSHAPLFITLAHHYWNMLAGHCESLPIFFDQNEGKESGITDAGREMIEDLLSDKNAEGEPNKTRRILIDVKHMSPLARKQYYRYINQIRTKTGLHIPVICSHASIGDAPNLNVFIPGTEDFKTFIKPENYFNTSSLSLNDEDICAIINSDGLIGIILDEGQIATLDAKNKKPYRIRYYKRRIRYANQDIRHYAEQMKLNISDGKKKRFERLNEQKKASINESIRKMRKGYICMIAANIYKIVDVYSDFNPKNPAKGWDHITIGSDFDGTINELNYLDSSLEFPVLRDELLKFLKEPESLYEFNYKWSHVRLKELQFGISPELLIKKFMNENAELFLSKYFNEDYLVRGINPA